MPKQSQFFVAIICLTHTINWGYNASRQGFTNYLLVLSIVGQEVES